MYNDEYVNKQLISRLAVCIKIILFLLGIFIEIIINSSMNLYIKWIIHKKK